MNTIYTDNGAERGNRTRLFRDGALGGVEWMFAVDHAGGSTRWYGFGMIADNSITKLRANGMALVEYVSRETLEA